MSVIAFPKSGRLESPTYLAWIRRQSCCQCFAHAPSEADHRPPKQMGGAHVNDLYTIPLCHVCHRRVTGDTVVMDGIKLPPVTVVNPDAITAHFFRRFMLEAPPLEVDQVVRDIRRFQDTRMGGGIPA